MLRRAIRPSRVRLVRSSSSIPPPSYTQSQTPAPAVAPQALPAALAPQAPNHAAPWSTSQRLRPLPGSEPRFEQTAMDLQPTPLSAMELIDNEPIRLVEGRRAVCDGGGGPLGHPKIFINLDKPGPKPCGYCGIRFEQNRDHHH